MQSLPPVSDNDLRELILAALAKDDRTRQCILRVGVLNGFAHLAGTVNALENRTAAEEIALRIEGVRGVVNRIDAPDAPNPWRTINLHDAP